jgi:hypothetical protein
MIMQYQASGRGDAALAEYPPAEPAGPMLDPVAAVKLAGIARFTPRSLGRCAAEVCYSDGSWRPCRVVSWARIRGGRAILLVWPDRMIGWYRYDSFLLRPT